MIDALISLLGLFLFLNTFGRPYPCDALLNLQLLVYVLCIKYGIQIDLRIKKIITSRYIQTYISTV